MTVVAPTPPAEASAAVVDDSAAAMSQEFGPGADGDDGLTVDEDRIGCDGWAGIVGVGGIIRVAGGRGVSGFVRASGIVGLGIGTVGASGGRKGAHNGVGEQTHGHLSLKCCRELPH